MNEICDVKFVTAESAGDRVRAREFFAVEPDVGAVVDAAKREPDALALIRRRDDKFLAIPPGHGVRAIVGYLVVRELAADFVRDAGYGTQIHAKVRIFVDAVFNKHGEHGFGRGGRVPAFRGKADGRYLFRRRGDSCGGLHFPTVMKDGVAIGEQNRAKGNAKDETCRQANKTLREGISPKPFQDSHGRPCFDLNRLNTAQSTGSSLQRWVV